MTNNGIPRGRTKASQRSPAYADGRDGDPMRRSMIPDGRSPNDPDRPVFENTAARTIRDLRSSVVTVHADRIASGNPLVRTGSAAL